MSKYSPKTIDEVRGLISQNNVKLDTLSFTDLDKIMEIDVENLTAEVERGVTLGKLADEISKKGLIFAPFTPDKQDLTVGEMYAEQISSLTGAKYGNAKLHVMGLEVILPSGEVFKTGGKMVKNVTGYDLTRSFLSSRDTIGIPVVYTLKLLPKEEVKAFYLVTLSDYQKLKNLLEKLALERVVPAVFCFWNDYPENKKQVSLFLELNGIKEKVEFDRQKLTKIIQGMEETMIELDTFLLDKSWQQIRSLRTKEGWQDGFKVPQDKTIQFITEINKVTEVNLGYWGNPLQGKINIILLKAKKTKELYEKISTSVLKLGGTTSWYYDFQYGKIDKNLIKIFQRIKDKFDPQDIFNPIGGENE